MIARSSQILLSKTKEHAIKDEYRLNMDAVLSAHDAMEEKNQIKLDPTGKTSTNVIIYNSLSYERKGNLNL